MAFYHGIKTKQADTSVSTPLTAASGVSFVVGTAPVHITGGKVNEAVLANNYSEAVAALGYSDDWKKYTLCEVMYTHFKLFGVSPVIFVNVFDPATHKEAVTSSDMTVTDKKVILPLEAIASSIVVKASGGTGATYVKGTDYDLVYTDSQLVLEIIAGGSILATAAKLNIAYSKAKPESVAATDIVGGFNITTKKSTGFELVDSAFPKFGIVPDILLAPGFSQNATVSAIMAAKAENVNGIFESKAYVDVDTTAATFYTDVPTWKKTNNVNSKFQVLCYPHGKLDDKVFHMSSLAAALSAKVDSDNDGCPCESPSNKGLKITSTVNADGTEVALDIQQANFLNSNGVVTALNFVGGFVLWGNETACFPSSADAKNYFIPVSRTFAWVANSVILTYWSKVDNKLNRRLLDSIVDSINIWLNGLTSEEKLLGGRVEFKDEENTTTALMSGKAVFHIYLTPPSPAREIDFVLEYDSNYVTAALS